MNEVIRVRMASWAEIIKQRSESGMTVADWCAEYQINKSAYYYCLRQLHFTDFCKMVSHGIGRKLNNVLIIRLASCEYIVNCRIIFITDATGSGKTCMTYAFGMEACKQYYTVKYVRVSDGFF